MSFVAFDQLVAFAGTVAIPATRGRHRPQNCDVYVRQSLPTDPVGTTTVTFDGVADGSEIRIFLPDTTEAAGIESCAANQALTWPVYSAGSPNNTVRIVIIDMAHKIKEFSYTSKLGSQSIPVQEENDKWYSNP